LAQVRTDLYAALITPAAGIQSASQLTIADDAAGDFGDVAPVQLVQILIWGGAGSVRFFCGFHIRTVATLICTNVFGTTANIAAVTTNVTGTTGIDGNITVSATAGHLKIENRSGGGMSFAFLLLPIT
jgi:hypothetical protein